MSTLLGAGAPLRGRAVLELVVRPFGYREAAAFWGLDRPRARLPGQRPGRRDPGVPGDERRGRARSAADFDRWVQRRIINPASAMFREGSLLLREDPSIADPTSYAAVLTALSAGQARRTEIAAELGRPASALAHLLNGLQGIGLVEAVDDALRSKRTVYRITEPVVRLYQLIIKRHEAELVAGRAEQVWAATPTPSPRRSTGRTSRSWPAVVPVAREPRDPRRRGQPGAAHRIPCREHRAGHELDAVVWETRPGQADRIIAIGEAKATTARRRRRAERLEHLRGLLPADAGRPPHCCCSAARASPPR